jgi:hypothetical protein
MKGGGWYPVPIEGAEPEPEKPTTSTAEKLALGGLGLAVLGGIFGVLGSKKESAPSPKLGKSCCGR